MRAQRFEQLVFGQPPDEVGRRPERILELRQPLDQPGAPLEQLGELVGGQLPR
jgi:hypothetical protein